MITQAELKELLHYDPETGIFRWRHARKNNQIKPWGVAGSITDWGYMQIEINNKGYKSHRLAWLYITGEWPEHEIDHHDGVPSNNAWKNLRLATRKQNQENLGLFRNNTSGYRGVSKKNKKWQAYVSNNRKKIYLGYFDTAEEAAQAAAAKRAELFTHDTGRDQVNTFA
jgi:hypothetical protein